MVQVVNYKCIYQYFKALLLGPTWEHSRLICLWHQHSIWALVLVPAAPPLIHLSLLVFWESNRERTKALSPCTHMGNLEKPPVSQLQICFILAIAAIWGEDQRMEALSLSLCLAVCVCVSLSLTLTHPSKISKI